MPKFILKNPVEARQVTRENMEEIEEWLDDSLAMYGNKPYIFIYDDLYANLDDFVIKYCEKELPIVLNTYSFHELFGEVHDENK